MKRWSLHVATFGGTEVRIHATFLLLLAWIGLMVLGKGGPAAAWEAILFLVAMFICVLLHEFGQWWLPVATAFTPQISPSCLSADWPGSSACPGSRRRNSSCLAGPAVNVAIAGLLFIALQVLPAPSLNFNMVDGPFAVRLMVWNLIMVLFNMIPAFPMDGGRVLRAALAMFLDYGKATRLAAGIGQAIAIIGPWWHSLSLKTPSLSSLRSSSS
ncbi:hypothetical protein [Verrucomicrobium spinosum]|uniref:hypothetical protein n=1 Tax=Verrucomicrobium spinosum TaxID=2736 RepID=UPI000A78147C|nr:hypothetical protein [Verrucomicrobium spinosum]